MRRVLTAAALGFLTLEAMAQTPPNPTPVNQGPTQYEGIIGKISLTKKGNVCNIFTVTDRRGWFQTFVSPDDAYWSSVVAYDGSRDTVRVAWDASGTYYRRCPDPYGSSNLISIVIPNAIVRQDSVP